MGIAGVAWYIPAGAGVFFWDLYRLGCAQSEKKIPHSD
jgi:hypothetical protein